MRVQCLQLAAAAAVQPAVSVAADAVAQLLRASGACC